MIDDGGRVHPIVLSKIPDPERPGHMSTHVYSGMSLRAHFAGLAMQGQLACGDIADSSPSGVAKYALEYADALIAALKESKP